MLPNTTRYGRLSAWLREGIWREPSASLPRYRAWPLRWLRILLASFRGFSADQATIRASALTFYSVLAVVPLAALAFGIAKGFGVESMLESALRDRLAGQEEIAEWIVAFSQNQLRQTRGGVVAGAGVLLLLWTAARVLTNIEISFNAVWNTPENRPFFRKIGDYLAILFLAPILLISASSLTVYITAALGAWAGEFALWGVSGAAAGLAARLLPAALLWLLFTGMYLVMPNTRVPVLSAAVGGVAAGTLFQATQALYFRFQFGAAEFGAIYGSFAALPLFLIWMQLSWTIVLYGAELARAHQDGGALRPAARAAQSGPAFGDYAALAVMRRLVQAALRAEAPPDAEAVARGTGLTEADVSEALRRLLETRQIVRADFGDGSPRGYLPARDAGSVGVGEVLAALRGQGAEEIPPQDDPAMRLLRDCAAGGDAQAKFAELD